MGAAGHVVDCSLNNGSFVLLFSGMSSTRFIVIIVVVVLLIIVVVVVALPSRPSGKEICHTF